jgi:hypothetical protein
MSLPNSYTIKTGAVPDYFEAMLNAQPPERFSHKFLEGLGFLSSNDRLFIGILKELGFLNSDGAPTQRYFNFLDRSVAPRIVADGVRDAFEDLFAVNTTAFKLGVDDAYNKLRTLYKGEKKDTVIKNIARTFVALCEYADFSSDPKVFSSDPKGREENNSNIMDQERVNSEQKEAKGEVKSGHSLSVSSLQYHINILLPESRDQAVYDAIFKSLRDHLG